MTDGLEAVKNSTLALFKKGRDANKGIKKADEARWNEYVERSPVAIIYHTLAWRSVSTEVFGHKPVFLCAEENGKFKVIMPLFLVSGIFGKRLVSVSLWDRGGTVR